MEDDFDETGKFKRRKNTKFQKGVSPNPGGRPKGSRSKSSFEKATQMKVWVIIDGKRRRVSAEEAMFMALMKNGVKGDISSFREFLRLKELYVKEQNSQTGVAQNRLSK